MNVTNVIIKCYVMNVIIKNWLHRLSLMSKHSGCQSKKWLFELFHLCTAKSKFLS